MKDLRILYIDDEEDLLSLASSFFEDEGMRIDTCTEFAEALSRVRSTKYDLIISDSRLPTGSGKELLSIIRQEKVFEGKFILVTGNIDFSDETESKLYDRIMFKPLRFQELVEQVKAMLSV